MMRKLLGEGGIFYEDINLVLIFQQKKKVSIKNFFSEVGVLPFIDDRRLT